LWAAFESKHEAPTVQDIKPTGVSSKSEPPMELEKNFAKKKKDKKDHKPKSAPVTKIAKKPTPPENYIMKKPVIVDAKVSK